MKSIFVLLLLTTLGSTVVVEKWHKSDDGTTFYIEENQKYNWFEAWNECASKDLALITIDSFEKHQQIDKLLRKLYPINPSFWLAANALAVDKQFVWVTNGQPIAFSNWGTNQPDATGEQCVFLMNKFWDWHDVACTAKNGYICEENSIASKTRNELAEMRKCCEKQTNTFTKYNSILFSRR